MLLGTYDHETIRADELESGDFIWYSDKPCRIYDVTINEQTTSFTAIVGCGMYGTMAFMRPNAEPQIRILNPGVLF